MSEKKKPTAKKTEKKTTKATSKKTKATSKTKSENTIEEVSTDEVVEQSATKSEVSKESVVEDSPKEETVDQAKDEKEKEITSDSQEEATSHENTVESEETTFDDSLAASTPKSQEEDVDFDWESFEKGDEEYTTSEREVLEKDYLSTLNTIESDQVIDGRVVSITDREVIVNINYKSDGIISRNEFRYKEDFQVGDTVEVLVEKKEDKKGQLILSHKKARVFRSWEKVNEAFD